MRRVAWADNASAIVKSEDKIEEWRRKARDMARRMLVSDDDRKTAICFLGMSKRGKRPQVWALRNLMDAWRYPDVDPVTGEPFSVIE